MDSRLRELDRATDPVDPVTRLTLLRRAGVDGIDAAVTAAQALTDAVYGACRGAYQRSLLDGGETWSGSSLVGKAAKYGGRYAESRVALLARIQVALVAVDSTVDTTLDARTDIDRTRNGKRRLQIQVGATWLDWLDTSHEEFALAIYDAVTSG